MASKMKDIKVLRHSRYFVFQMAEVAIRSQLFLN